MKVLDVRSMDTDIDLTVKEINNFQNQVTNLQKAVRGVVSLEDSLKGKGGKAIRSFYDKSHQPFLIYMYDFLLQFEQTLNQTKQAVHSFEPDPNGYVRQDFIENEVGEGLRKIEDVTINLTNEANDTIRSVQDIISLPQLNEDELVTNLQHGKRKAQETLEQLHELDQSQAHALESLQQMLQTMKNYVSEMEGKFKRGDISIENFNSLSLRKSDAYNSILEKVNPLHHALNKLEDIFSYIAPYMAMLLPHKMFPISFRGHAVSKTPPKFDRIKENDTYKELAQKNELTVEEDALLSDYIATSDPDRPKYSKADFEDPEHGPITYWDKRKVYGGNSSLAGSPDGLAGYSLMAYHFITDDIATVFNNEASLNERMISGLFILPTPAKFLKPLDDVAMGLKKGRDVGKAGKGAKSVNVNATTWSLNDNGAIINGRNYTVHALERMAPNIPEVRAKLFSKATKRGENLGLKPGTKDYKKFMTKYIDPRNIPPTVIEHAIKTTKAIQGNRAGTFIHETRDVRIIINNSGDVITVIPK